MSFQAYLNTIKSKTGKGPEDFRKMAEEKGFSQDGELKPGIKAGEIVDWLKEEFELGSRARHGCLCTFERHEKRRQRIAGCWRHCKLFANNQQ